MLVKEELERQRERREGHERDAVGIHAILPEVTIGRREKKVFRTCGSIWWRKKNPTWQRLIHEAMKVKSLASSPEQLYRSNSLPHK